MKRVIIAILFALLQILCLGQSELQMEILREQARNHGLKEYSYHAHFVGKKGYAAPIIMTSDNGSLFMGGNVNVVKLNSAGQLQWKKFIVTKFDEIETQSVLEDHKGNFYVFLLSYNYAQYRGGAERVIYMDKNGNIIWDKLLGAYSKIENPHCSYIKLQEDGTLELRGHIVPESDPENYHFWTGKLDHEGKLIQKVGDVIDWKDTAWKTFTKTP